MTELLGAIEAELPGQDLRLDLCEVPDRAYRAHYGQFCNPFLWFLQHEMWNLPERPLIDAATMRACSPVR